MNNHKWLLKNNSNTILLRRFNSINSTNSGNLLKFINFYWDSMYIFCAQKKIEPSSYEIHTSPQESWNTSMYRRIFLISNERYYIEWHFSVNLEKVSLNQRIMIYLQGSTIFTLIISFFRDYKRPDFYALWISTAETF